MVKEVDGFVQGKQQRDRLDFLYALTKEIFEAPKYHISRYTYSLDVSIDPRFNNPNGGVRHLVHIANVSTFMTNSINVRRNEEYDLAKKLAETWEQKTGEEVKLVIDYERKAQQKA